MSKNGTQREAAAGHRLKEREKKVLTLTVYYYISSGEPVGSRFLSKKLDLGLSPATVRNVMADLEEMGFLRQPHPSSGRIPTDLGYRCYVDQLIRLKRLRPATVKQMRDRLRHGGTTVEEIFQKTSRTLSSVSSHLGLVMGPRIYEEGFRQLQFIRVGRRRVLAVIVSDRLMPLQRFIWLSRRTMSVIRQNLGWAFSYNIVALPLAASGLLHPIISAVFMVLSSLIVVGNSLRLNRG